MRCPKCSSSACSGSEFLNARWRVTQRDYKVHCMMCGSVRYGEQARQLIEDAEQENLPAPVVEQEEIVTPQITKCAWHKCSEPKRANSIYCSDKCRIAMAHANEMERRKVTKRKHANVPAAPGISPNRKGAG